MWPLLLLQNEVKEPAVESDQGRCLCTALLIFNEKHRQIHYFFFTVWLHWALSGIGSLTILNCCENKQITFAERHWQALTSASGLKAPCQLCNWRQQTDCVKRVTKDLTNAHICTIESAWLLTPQRETLWRCAVYLECCPSLRMTSFNVMRLLGRLPGPLLFVPLQSTCPCCRWKLSSAGHYCVCVCVSFINHIRANKCHGTDSLFLGGNNITLNKKYGFNFSREMICVHQALNTITLF